MPKKTNTEKQFTRRCLSCGKIFSPIDRTRNWICPKCRKRQDQVSGSEDVSTFELRAAEPTFDAEG